ncbi:2,3-butanediol dehydrogenase [Peribacillus butanolivorans]|uniref:2,3-butanediol dehydrogenase n=1 Tax=Peribacillus butanolivorans TaxID=421767 RepID=UPI0036C44D7F
MKTAKFYSALNIQIEEIQQSKLDVGLVKVAVEWAGICGSDMHEFLAGPFFAKPKVTLGHEFSGTVVEVGAGVTKVSVGDRVVVEPFYSCEDCDACTEGLYNLCKKIECYGISNDGGFAEFVTVRETKIFKIPEELSFEVASLVEPTAVALHAVRKSQLKSGDSCAIFGAGPIGLLLVQVAKVVGAKEIIVVELSEERRKKAIEMGATYVINPENEKPVKAINRIVRGGVHVAFEAAGAESSFISALASLKHAGELMIVSLWEKSVSFTPNMLVIGEKKINSSLGYRHNFQEVIELLASGKINGNKLITKKIYIEDIVKKGFEKLKNDKSQCKILVTPIENNLEA